MMECMMPYLTAKDCVNTLRLRQDGCQFPDDISKCIFLNENIWILFIISLKFVPEGSINHIPSLVQIMAWRWPGDKPLSEPLMVSLLMHICGTRPQWVKQKSWHIHTCHLNYFESTNKALIATTYGNFVRNKSPYTSWMLLTHYFLVTVGYISNCCSLLLIMIMSVISDSAYWVMFLDCKIINLAKIWSSATVIHFVAVFEESQPYVMYQDPIIRQKLSQTINWIIIWLPLYLLNLGQKGTA